MFFTIFIGIAIVIYCLYNLIDIDMFVHKFHGANIERTIDAFAIIGITIWLIVQFFMQSGIIAIIPMVFLFATTDNKSKRREINQHRALLLTIILVVSFIILNKYFMNINFWHL